MATDMNVPPGERQLDEIFRAEIASINQRRRWLQRDDLVLEGSGDQRKMLDAVGLALSGGGVRSAAFSLGVVQALNHNDVLRNVDYISTVSGGGYIGSSLTATMTSTQGEFAFGIPPTAEFAGAEISDTAAVGHLRNYSNYLIPAGGRDLLTGVTIVIRGLVANLALVLPVILLLAALTVLANPLRTDLYCPDLFGFALCKIFPDWPTQFALTLALLLLGLVLFLLWALYRSFVAPDRAAEFRTKLPVLAAAYLVLLGGMFFIELQTFFINGMFDLKLGLDDDQSLKWLTGGLTTMAAIVTPIAAVVTFFRQQLGDILKATTVNARASTKAVAVLSKMAFWVAGAAVPLLVWVAYLHLAYWGIFDDSSRAPRADAAPPSETVGQATTDQATEDQGTPGPGTIGQALASNDAYKWDCYVYLHGGDSGPGGAHTPKWMLRTSAVVAYKGFCPIFTAAGSQWESTRPFFQKVLGRPMILLYFSVGTFLLILSRLLKPNANSLHRLYRDRLSKAFLFDPGRTDKSQSVTRNEPSVDQGRDFLPLDRLLISQLSSQYAPYHLINAALNIQGSDYANRRGRNADFFLFSPGYLGSEATGYAPTSLFEKMTRSLDLATAMAISGAAASSNMGSASIRPLRPTLALLNVRLGYWLCNPRYIGPHGKSNGNGSLRKQFNSFRKAMTPYLWSEISGRLYENSNEVYLTDGGHIENLGVYELLRRRCKLIVVVDGEADLAMHFPSFVTLQRYARIDLGIIITMPWDKIQKATCCRMGVHAGDNQSPPDRAKGPHAAIGQIDYGGGEHGYLLYIKSSLTGDENDYVRDYARRHEDFPHETTGDQFFSEEQFEVYRSLGFHAAQGVLSDRDGLQVCDSESLLMLKDENDAVKVVRAALRGKPGRAHP
jgi:Patatin-like phospholipase